MGDSECGVKFPLDKDKFSFTFDSSVIDKINNVEVSEIKTEDRTSRFCWDKSVFDQLWQMEIINHEEMYNYLVKENKLYLRLYRIKWMREFIRRYFERIE